MTPHSPDVRFAAFIVDALAFVLAFVGAVALCAVEGGCKPNLPPVSGCHVGAYHCTAEGRPEVCSASSRWEPIGSTRCAAVGAVCVAPIDGPAHCARAQTDAAAEAPDASDGGAE